MNFQALYHCAYQNMPEYTPQELPAGMLRPLAQAALFMNQSSCADSQIDHSNGQPKCDINAAGISKIKNTTLFEQFLHSNGFAA